MTEQVISYYTCSECDAKISSEGTEALDHMVEVHGCSPDGPQVGDPSLIPLPEEKVFAEDN